MTALAEILKKRGAILTGSDVADVFYTDSILHSLGVELLKTSTSKIYLLAPILLFTLQHIRVKEILSSRRLPIEVYLYLAILKCLELFLCIADLLA